ncbi:MAG: hypothetical protein P8N76_07020 [Pirellulaceae bacterium]|nr:hypothetical protein [Pirellulaceae bacterium]
MVNRTRVTLGLCLTILLIGLCGADEAANRDSMPGIAAGAVAPGFRLKDQTGRFRQLSEFVKPDKFVALVFHRSADW